MKLINILLLLLFMAVPVYADQFTTTLNTNTSNDYITIATESGTTTYYCNQSSTNTYQITLNRDISSTTDLRNLSAQLSNLISEMNTRENYYKLYLGCYVNLTYCRMDLGTSQDNTDWKAKYNDLTTANANLQNQLSQQSRDYSTCDADKKVLTQKVDNEGMNKWFFAGGGILIGFAISQYFQKRKEGPGEQHPGIRDYPTGGR